uniref:Uncharacterized protein n=1 Tax=Tetraselmis sp. GSL018 TaxID=582737 RepID=A0A061RT43_9CHLO|eukprot:CAMPEP_0177622168 /NCGR_PEP_ID=MMETSP0419_2-20121207/28069_1 /TAXON_ID=582737 /ORGANISM="Tetraselmis sp., Strain GSL018" /LENGTH=140 /DNA_ID=CAMNT_0019122323 /DNA_START=45 /DNA_END=467 /DNA_ORIENTATION=-
MEVQLSPGSAITSRVIVNYGEAKYDEECQPFDSRSTPFVTTSDNSSVVENKETHCGSLDSTGLNSRGRSQGFSGRGKHYDKSAHSDKRQWNRKAKKSYHAYSRSRRPKLLTASVRERHRHWWCEVSPDGTPLSRNWWGEA